MHLRIVLYALLSAAFIGGVVAVADALVVTDEEALAGIADNLTTPRGEDRLGLLLRHVDPARQPLTVEAGSRARAFREAGGPALDRSLEAALRPLAERPGLREVQRTVHVRGDRGTVALRYRDATGEPLRLTLTLRRNGQGWLLARLDRS